MWILWSLLGQVCAEHLSRLHVDRMGGQGAGVLVLTPRAYGLEKGQSGQPRDT